MLKIIINSLEIEDLLNVNNDEGEIKEAIIMALQQLIEQNGMQSHLRQSNSSMFLDTVSLEVSPEASMQEIAQTIAKRIYQNEW